MNSIYLSMIVLACCLGGVLLGTLLHAVVPERHRQENSRDVVKTASGMIATLVALVLGLLTASAKSSFDGATAGMNQTAAKLIQVNRTLTRYGPEALPAREHLRRGVTERIEQLWPTDHPREVNRPALQDSSSIEQFQDLLRRLAPENEAQRHLQSQALQIADELEQLRWQLFTQSTAVMPPIFLGILVFWLLVLNTSFGLLAPRNPTIYVALLICALSVSGAIFLILEMDHPLTGFMKISDAPMRKALEFISQP